MVGETIEDVYVCSADVIFIVVDVEGKEIGKVEGVAEGAEHVDFVLEIDRSFLIISKLALVLQRFVFQNRLESFAITIKFLYNGTIPEG